MTDIEHRRTLIRIELLVCRRHKISALCIDDIRITGSKCCGQWHVEKSWHVDAQELKELAERKIMELK